MAAPGLVGDIRGFLEEEGIVGTQAELRLRLESQAAGKSARRSGTTVPIGFLQIH